ncbi:MAG: ELWxxDGT repeat protein [Planctomycetota bacterium]
MNSIRAQVTRTGPVLVAILGSWTALAAQGAPSPARLLADLNLDRWLSQSSAPDQLTQVGAVSYFAADDGVHGRELFRTLGTAASTALVADIAPGSASSGPQALRAVGSRLFFTADDGTHGRELWVTDGGAAGTRLVADIAPGARGPAFGERAALGNRLVLDVDDTISGFEPWISDGTAAGTFRLADIVPGSGASRTPGVLGFMVSHLAASGNEVLFTVTRSGALELWGTDGTGPGTTWRATLRNGVSFAPIFTRTVALPDGSLIFAEGPDTAAQNQLAIWRTDGTAAGTSMVGSLPMSSLGHGPILFDGRVFFMTRGDAMAVATDGTIAGTVTIPLDTGGLAQPGIEFLGEVDHALWGVGPVPLNDVIYRLERGASAFVEAGVLPFLYVGDSRGEAANCVALGSRLLMLASTSRLSFRALDPRTLEQVEFAMASATGSSQLLRAAGNVLFASDTSAGIEPSISDGTLLGTHVLVDLNTQPPVPGSGPDSLPSEYVRAGGWTVFRATMPDGDALIGSDGTTAGTMPIQRGFTSILHPIVSAGSRVFFAAETTTLGRELWVSEGSSHTTHVVADLAPGPESGVDRLLGELGGEVLFLGTSLGVTGLHASDGTVTQFVARVSAAQPSTRVAAARLGERIVFRMPTASGADLWSTDGTASHTVHFASTSSYAVSDTGFVQWKDRLCYLDRDAHAVPQLFATDGTNTGTVPVGDLGLTPSSPMPFFVVASISRLWVIGNGVLWFADDPTVGPVAAPVPAHVPYAWNSPPAVLGDTLLFDVDGGTNSSPARHDGSTNGFELLTGVSRGSYADSGFAVLDARHALFAMNPSGGTQRELWITDGHASGTHRFQTLETWSTSASTQQSQIRARVVNGRLWFAARDPVTGIEPYVVDIGAVGETVGDACGGTGRAAMLAAISDPVLGARCELQGTATAGNLAVPLLGFPSLSPLRLSRTGSCRLEVAPDFVALPALRLTAGRFTFALDVPDIALLDGIQLALQAVMGPTDAPLGFDLGNGVLLTLGR